jgi:MFS transporter, CP family, cyanate transporter
MKRIDPAWLVVLAGVSAALHVSKMPPALPVLRDALHLSLVQAGFLLSLVQLAGMSLGLVIGLGADGLGPRRTMVLGLVILSLAGAGGAAVESAEALLALRGLEGLGFLLASLPAPALIRRLVEPARLSRVLGLWGAYMPLGTALALLAGPLVIVQAGWHGWWAALAAVSMGMAVWLWRAVPATCDAPMHGSAAGSWKDRVRSTLGSVGPWLAALAFAAYSAQWLAVVGFLPTIYAQAGMAVPLAGVATALAAAVNIAGNVASGRLLHRGVPAGRLLAIGFAAMAAGAIIAFAPWGSGSGSPLVRYAGVLLFSMVGGLIPGTLFSLSVRLAPDAGAVSTTVGWMQQWSSIGQFAGPPLVAFAAARTGSWDAIWWITGGLALAGMLLAGAIARHLRSAPRIGAETAGPS